MPVFSNDELELITYLAQERKYEVLGMLKEEESASDNNCLSNELATIELILKKAQI